MLAGRASCFSRSYPPTARPPAACGRCSWSAAPAAPRRPGRGWQGRPTWWCRSWCSWRSPPGWCRKPGRKRKKVMFTSFLSQGQIVGCGGAGYEQAWCRCWGNPRSRLGWPAASPPAPCPPPLWTWPAGRDDFWLSAKRNHAGEKLAWKRCSSCNLRASNDITLQQHVLSTLMVSCTCSMSLMLVAALILAALGHSRKTVSTSQRYMVSKYRQLWSSSTSSFFFFNVYLLYVLTFADSWSNRLAAGSTVEDLVQSCVSHSAWRPVTFNALRCSFEIRLLI